MDPKINQKADTCELHYTENVLSSFSQLLHTVVPYAPDRFNLGNIYRKAISYANSIANQNAGKRLELRITLVNYPDDFLALIQADKNYLNSRAMDEELIQTFDQITLESDGIAHTIYERQ